jgi:hypothetical protein
MSELDTSGSVEGLGRATSPVYSTGQVTICDPNHCPVLILMKVQQLQTTARGDPCARIEVKRQNRAITAR